MTEARILVYSSLFPCAAAPTTGTFIRERMFRVARHLPVTIVAPQPWSPADGLIRRSRPAFRPQGEFSETMDGVNVHRPRFLSIPGVLKGLDGGAMARGSAGVVDRLIREFRPTVIDAHFVYPDGYAAARLADRFALPLTITLRGSKDTTLIGTDREPKMRWALDRADRIFSVSDSLVNEVGTVLGQRADKILVVRNGVDLDKFQPVDKSEARQRLGLPVDAKVVIGVGHLSQNKGFQRVVPLLPRIRKDVPDVHYLIVGGSPSQGSMLPQLQALARAHGVEDRVHFCGRQLPEDLKWFYGAADVFALASDQEGWANVLLEAMACGIPVVATAVGGNAQVVASPDLGTLVPYWEPEQFAQALVDALARRSWDLDRLLAYARSRSWDEPVSALVEEFRRLTG